MNVVNVIALLTLAIVSVILFFPGSPNPAAASMNWTIVLLPAVIILLTAYFYLHARHDYKGPVALVNK